MEDRVLTVISFLPSINFLICEGCSYIVDGRIEPAILCLSLFIISKCNWRIFVSVRIYVVSFGKSEFTQKSSGLVMANPSNFSSPSLLSLTSIE